MNSEFRISNSELRTTKGFTLVELVLVIVILGLLAGLAVPLAFNLIESFQYSIYRKDLSEQADAVLRRMGREMRRLRDAQSVIAAGAADYRFVDIDNRPIRFGLNGANLERESGAQVDVLATDIASLSFTYYLDDGETVINTPLVGDEGTDIRFIEINMTLQSDGNSIHYRTQIRPRRVPHFGDLFS